MSGNAGDWVRGGTPRETGADWEADQSDYGTAVGPEEWDDYSSEQSVPVDGRPSQATPGDRGSSAVEARTEPSQQAETEADQSVEPGQSAEHDQPLQHDQSVENVQSVQPDQSAEPDQPVEPVQLGEEVQESRDEDVPRDADGWPIPADEQPSSAPVAAEPVMSHDARVHAPTADEVDLPETQDDEPRADEAPQEPVGEPDLEATAFHRPIDDEATRPRPVVTPVVTNVVAGAAPLSGASPLPAGLYRDASDETRVMAAPAAHTDLDEQEAEERRLQEQLAAERHARNQRLGVVAPSGASEAQQPVGFTKLHTDRFLPSLGLFVLRLVTAAVLGVAGYRILMAPEATAQTLQATLVPEPQLSAWILGATLAALALLLVIGMLQRLVGLVLLAFAVASLVLLRWGPFNIFSPSFEGFPFLGDKELLLAGIGMLLLSMGGGSWGVDGAFRRSRAQARADRAA